MKRCVITAGKTKTGRQQYISSYKDCDDWDISVIPTITNQTRAYQVLAKVKKELPILHKSRNWAHMQKDTPLEIIEVDENFIGVVIL